MASFEERLEAACHDGTVPGAILTATNVDGSFRYQKAVQGKNPQEPIDSNYQLDSVLGLASCTKLITTVASLQCVDRGLIRLDEDVSKWLPELGKSRLKVLLECDEGKEPVFEDMKTPITLRLLLTHTAGFGTGLVEPHLKRYRERQGTMNTFFTSPSVFEKFYCPLATQPGTFWSYNSGHDWACKVVEKLTGRTMEEFIRTNICGPLGITSMTYWPEKHSGLRKRLLLASKRGKDARPFKAALTGGVPDADDAPLFPMPEWPPVKNTECFGGEGLHSSVPDYLKVLHSLLANDQKLLKAESVTQLFTPQFSPAVREQLNATWRTGFGSLAPGDYPSHIGLDWGLGAMLSTEEDPGWRSKGTLSWSGIANCFWFIDRQKGLCGMFGTQLLPGGDNKVRELTSLWEKEMYRLAAERENATNRSGIKQVKL